MERSRLGDVRAVFSNVIHSSNHIYIHVFFVENSTNSSITSMRELLLTIGHSPLCSKQHNHQPLPCHEVWHWIDNAVYTPAAIEVRKKYKWSDYNCLIRYYLCSVSCVYFYQCIYCTRTLCKRSRWDKAWDWLMLAWAFNKPQQWERKVIIVSGTRTVIFASRLDGKGLLLSRNFRHF